MEKNLVRLLKADEIECRVSMVNEKGLSLLLYKDARVDQKILDETFGPFGWKRSHQCIDGNLYCTVEVLDRETGEWVAKQDVGTMGHAEKEKSQASDSFKRACFNWGIGRELYSAPFIWIPAGKAAIQQKDGKHYCNDRFSVAFIEYGSGREISSLIIRNGKGQTVFELGTYGAANVGNATPDSTVDKGQAKEKKDGRTRQEGELSGEQMKSLQKELARTGVTLKDVKERYKIQKPEAMGEELYKKVMSALAKTKTAA